MLRTRILNEIETDEFNKKYGTNYLIIHIKQSKQKFYAIADCNHIIRLNQSEAVNYFIK